MGLSFSYVGGTQPLQKSHPHVVREESNVSMELQYEFIVH